LGTPPHRAEKSAIFSAKSFSFLLIYYFYYTKTISLGQVWNRILPSIWLRGKDIHCEPAFKDIFLQVCHGVKGFHGVLHFIKPYLNSLLQFGQK